MNELLIKLHQLTLELENSIAQQNIDKVNLLLDQRNQIMQKIELVKVETEGFYYTLQDKALLQSIFQIDQEMKPTLEKLMQETKKKLNQMKKNKEVSKKYQPYIQQTSGVFLDQKK